jgi:large subunit ribosomal protein L15
MLRIANFNKNMQLHELKPAHRLKRKKRIGRGGKRGTYSGRGQKGQRARAGAKIKPMEREMILRIPKRRGLGFQRTRQGAKPLEVLSLTEMEKHFNDGAVISPKSLISQGIIARRYGKIPNVKIVGGAKLAKRFDIIGCALSKSAKTSIEAAGGAIIKENSN